MVCFLSGERWSSARFGAVAESDPNEMLTWTEPPYTFLSCCSTIIFIFYRCLSVLVRDESRNPKFRGRDTTHFWHFSSFLTPSDEGGKKRQVDIRVNSTFIARIQNSYLSPELDSTGSILKREASSVQVF